MLPSAGRRDDTTKRYGYAAFGVLEYWRFDPSGGQYHRAHLAGDVLSGGAYRPVAIHQTDDEHFWGHSEVLNLDLCWEQGELRWYDPAARRYLPTYADERAARVVAENQRAAAERRLEAAENQRAAAEAQREAAERRIRELEEELRRNQDSTEP